MKRILVPTDFSENAANALQYAVELAKAFKGEITLLHAYQTMKRSDMMVSIADMLQREAEEAMAKLAKKIPEEVVFQTKVLRGEPIRLIEDMTKRMGFDLIVMGTQGASGLKKVFIGSTAGGVMRNTAIPILAVPAAFSYRPVRKIVFAVADIRLSGAEAVQPLIELVRRLNAEVKVYHHAKASEESGQEKLIQAVDWLKGVPYTLHFEVDEDHINENIASFVESVDADMLCMIRRTRGQIGFFERIFESSVTMTHVFNCKAPLLILRDQ